MTTATDPGTGLAYDLQGTGPPVVFLHGLTFDRHSWRPIVERLDGSVTSVTIDLPAHGDSGGEPEWLESLAQRLHRLLMALAVQRPIVVGHSMSAGLAALYAAAYPTRGMVAVDQGMEIRPFAQLVHRLEPMLRGPGFDQVWQDLDTSIGLDLVPEPTRTQVGNGRRVRQDIVLGYWEQVLSTDPDDLQAWIDEQTRAVNVPCLGVFGRTMTDGERDRFHRLPDVQIEEWEGGGHCVHLVDPSRFAARLRQFVEYCDRAH